MNTSINRSFEAKPAVREAVGLLIGLVGPSSCGKTYSALRIASGIQRVVGGEIDVIDTENGRALYYADKFRFNHVRFGAPFSPLDYLEAIRYCAKRGAKTIVVDSMSHEHEGPGGVLEWHEVEAERLAKLWQTTVSKAQMAAWGPPKSARRKFINELLQLNVNVIGTFRAKEKIKIVSGKEPVPLGWQPIAGDEFIYEMTLQCLMKPGANGVPTWQSDLDSERAIMKLPSQFKEIFAGNPQQIDEDLGEKLAQWAVGGSKPAPELDELISDYAKCTDLDGYKKLEARRGKVWATKMPAGYKPRIKEASDAALKRVSEEPAANPAAQTAGSVPTIDDTKCASDIRATASVEEFNIMRESVVSMYEAASKAIPLEVDAAIREHEESLLQEEEA